MPRSLIGVDIGTSGARAVHVRQGSRGKIQVARVGAVTLPPGALVNGEMRDTAAVAVALKQLWKRSKFRTRAVCLGLGNTQTFVRRADILFDGELSHLRGLLSEQLSGEMSADADELVFDGYPMYEFVDKSGDVKMDTFVVGALSAASENLYAASREAKLRPSRIDHSAFALIRASVVTFGEPGKVPGPEIDDTERSCEVVVDLGAQSILIAIHHEGRPALIRHIQGGGESITRALMDHLGLSFEQAETVKAVLGIAPVARENAEQTFARVAEAGLDPSLIQNAQQVINLMASALLQRVRETTEFYLASDSNILGVERLILSGGASRLPGLADRLAAELRTDVGYLSPLQAFAPNKGKGARWGHLDPEFSLAFGLALDVK